MSVAYVNGQKTSIDDVKISVNDFGFNRGNSVFELTRVYGSKPFRLNDHLDRLFRSLELCHIRQPFSKEDFERMTLDLISENNFAQSAVKVYVTQGAPRSAGWSLEVSGDYEPTVIVMQSELKPYSDIYPNDERYYKEGMAVATVNVGRSLPEAKTTNYMNAIIESSKVAESGFEDIVYVDEGGNVLECSRSNLFFVKAGVLVTPAVGVLPGITRKVMLEIAEGLGVKIEERAVHVSELADMDEVFMTGSTVEAMPINKIDGHTYNVSEFSVYLKVWRAFKEMIFNL